MLRLPTPLFALVALAFAGCVGGCQSTSTAGNDANAATGTAQSNASGGAPQSLVAAGEKLSVAATPSLGSAAVSGGTAARPLAASNASVEPSMVSAAGFEGTEYRLAPQDIIEISVFQVPDLTKVSEISAKGAIVLPLIGSVQAAGRTPTELEKEIEARLSKDYLQSPEVSVMVKEYNSQKVTVVGAVGRPGVYEAPGGASLLRVLAMAGGLDRVADAEKVIVYRNQGGRRAGATFDVEAIREGRADDPVVRGGDTIVVDESDSKVAWRNVRESVGVAGFVTGLVP